MGILLSHGGGGNHGTELELMFQPIVAFLNWCRTFRIYVADGISFTFMEFWTYIFLACVLIGFIIDYFEGRNHMC